MSESILIEHAVFGTVARGEGLELGYIHDIEIWKFEGYRSTIDLLSSIIDRG
jgi:hypothetical protein